jgi:signal transduction histidine kinase
MTADSYGIRLALPVEAQSVRDEARYDMNEKRLRLLAVAAPLAIVLALEFVRGLAVGTVDLGYRLLLDGIVIVSFGIFGVVMVRAIGNMQNQLKRQNRELLALHTAGLDIASELSLDAVLKKVVELACTLVGAQYGALSVVGEDGSIRAFLTSGISQETREAIGPPPVGHGVLGVVLNEGQRLRLQDIAKHPRSVGFPANHPAMKTLLAVPVICKSPFRGNLYLAEKNGGVEFTADDEETLDRFAVQAAIAIDNAHLHQQVANLAVAQERLHIAHEMHDGIAQVLGYVNTKVQAATEYLRRGDADEATAQLRELATSARAAYGDVREAIVDLRTLPEADRDFGDVIKDYIDRWKEQTGISTHVVIDGQLDLPVAAELQLVRIVQESLANVRKHAKATTATVSIARRNGALLLTVTDDGVGFNTAARSRSDFPRFGLSTMRERAESIGGTMQIDSTPGSGTTVKVEVPIS